MYPKPPPLQISKYTTGLNATPYLGPRITGSYGRGDAQLAGRGKTADNYEFTKKNRLHQSISKNPFA